MELVRLAMRRLALVWVALTIVYKYLMGDSQEEAAKVSLVSSEGKSSTGHK